MKVQLLRPDDLLDLYIETVNLKSNKENPNNPILMQDDSSQPSFLIIKFPPQNIAEQAFYDNTNMGGYSQRPIPPNPDPPNGFPISPTPAGKVYVSLAAQLDWHLYQAILKFHLQQKACLTGQNLNYMFRLLQMSLQTLYSSYWFNHF